MLAVIAAAGLSLVPHQVDPDLFWQLRAGRDILQQRAVALPDSWTYLFEGQPWVNQQWLAQVVFQVGYAAAGFWGLCVVRGILIGAAAFFGSLAARRHASPAAILTAGLMVMLAIRPFLLFRTHLFSLVGFSVLSWILLNLRGRSKTLALVALFGLWANLHAFVTLALAIAGIHAIIGIAVAWKSALPGAGGPSASQRAGLILGGFLPLVAGALATGLNPHGFRIWFTGTSLFTQGQHLVISEWYPIWTHRPGVSLPVAAAVLAILLLGWFARRNADLPMVVSAGALLAGGILTARLLPPALVFIAPVIAHSLENVRWPERFRKGAEWAPGGLAAVVLAAAAFGLSSRLTNPIMVPEGPGEIEYPVHAMTLLDGLEGGKKIFSEYDWGGYIAWRCGECRTVIDGRSAVLLFDSTHMTAWRNAVDAVGDWMPTLERGRPDYVLLGPRTRLAMQLGRYGWREIYADDVSVLFAREPSRLPEQESGSAQAQGTVTEDDP